MKPATRMLVALTVLASGVGRAQAGNITATLTANPSTINQGGSTGLTLSVSDQPFTSGLDEFYGAPYNAFFYTGFVGYGYLSSVSGDLFSGDGRTTILIAAQPFATSYSQTDAVTYLTPGTFTASVSGTVISTDEFIDGPFGTFFDSSSVNLFASTQIHVNDVAPTITSLNWVPVVTLGQDFGFTVGVSDPGLAAGETMTYAYDFSGTGTYTDLVSTGGASDSETHQFDTLGLHTIGIEVSDGHGGVTYASFNVEVDPSAPEPSSLVLFGMATAGLFGSTLRTRRRRVAAA